MSFSELGIEPYLQTPKPASEVEAEGKLDDLSHQIDMQLEEHKMSRRELGRLFRAVKELYLAHGKRIRGRGWRAFLSTKHLKRQTVDSWIIEYELNAGLREAKEPDEDDATNSSLPNFGKLAAPEQSTCSSEQATATSTRVFDLPPLEVEPTYPAAEPTSFLSVVPAAAAPSLTPSERLERAMEEVEQATRELIAKELTAPRTIHDFGASYIRCNVQRPVIPTSLRASRSCLLMCR